MLIVGIAAAFLFVPFGLLMFFMRGEPSRPYIAIGWLVFAAAALVYQWQLLRDH